MRSFDEKKGWFEQTAGLGKSFDVTFREMTFAGVRTGFLYLNGMIKDRAFNDILDRLSVLTRDDLQPRVFTAVVQRYLPHIQVFIEKDPQKVLHYVFSGVTAMILDREQDFVMIDARMYPARNPEEPITERMVRGSRDGFVETLLTNVALVRRRIRDPRLITELVTVADRSQTDVCLLFISDLVDQKLLEILRNRLANIHTDGIPIADQQLEEWLVKAPLNPYPMARYTERPDVVAAHLLDGHIVLMADTSPSVLIIPATFWQHLQHAEEFRHTPLIGTYLRIVRFLGVWASIWLSPLWLLFVNNTNFLPTSMTFIGPTAVGHIPLLLQFVFAEIGIDLMRMAAVHTPAPLATSTGLIAAVLIGDVAIKVGLFSPEVILYIAIVAIGSFATPSYELGLANRISRLVILLLTGIFGLSGFAIGSTIWILLLAGQRSFFASYLWPVFPLDLPALWDIIVRRPANAPLKNLRAAHPLDGKAT